MESEKFYHLRRKKFPNQNGFIIKVKNGDLENLTGENSDLEDICRIDSKGNLEITKKSYFCEDITQEKADIMTERYRCWITMQAYFSDTSNPVFYLGGCNF